MKQENSPDSEEIEGEDREAMESWGDYPLDTVFVRNEARTVSEIVKRIEKDRYKLDPDFQRDFVWSLNTQSRLIESCLMRLPLPVFYVAEDIDGRVIVVDGLQRLTTFYRFINNEFPLKDIAKSDPNSLITNKTFAELPIHLQERIEDTQLILYILDSKAPERVRLDIFERVNSGVALSRQHMRNCLYSGVATRCLKELASAQEFIKATGGTLSSKSMRDREFVNRFCAFYLLGHESYMGDMEEYLANALTQMNKMPEDTIEALQATFLSAMKLSFDVFSQHAFSKNILSQQTERARDSINISLFDCMATTLAKLSDNSDTISQENIAQRVSALLCYKKFKNSILFSTNSTASVSCRHKLLESALLKSEKTDIRPIVNFDMLKDGLGVLDLADLDLTQLDVAEFDLGEWTARFTAASKDFNNIIDENADLAAIELTISNIIHEIVPSFNASALLADMAEYARIIKEAFNPTECLEPDIDAEVD